MKMYIETYGCQMNDYESDRTFRLFHDTQGYQKTEDPTEADVVLYNTCSIREKADQKAMSSLGRLRSMKSINPKMVIAVGGCMAQSAGSEIRARYPFIDIVFGTHQWAELPEMVRGAQKKGEKQVNLEFYGWKKYNFLPYRDSKLSHPVSDLVTIQNGCDKFCTFCLVPFTRGREMSRPPQEIRSEVERLVSQGVCEVTLLGQNVNAYGRDRKGEISFAQLLQDLCEVTELKRLRFMTSHPAEFTKDIVETMAFQSKLGEHLHLPIQSGSDRILERMNRHHGLKRYREVIAELRSKIPNFTLTTDIIVGFPSETEEDFQRTLDAVQEFEFYDSYSFAYSPRPHTKAAKWSEEHVPKEVCSERLKRLQDLQMKIKIKKNQRQVGTTHEVLVEGFAKKGEGQVSGRSSAGYTVNFDGTADDIGSLVLVEIVDASVNALKGKVAGVTDVH